LLTLKKVLEKVASNNVEFAYFDVLDVFTLFLGCLNELLIDVVVYNYMSICGFFRLLEGAW